MQNPDDPIDEVSAAVTPRRQDMIDVSGFDAGQTLTKERRRHAEAALSIELGPVDALLLPLALAIARLTARQNHGSAT